MFKLSSCCHRMSKSHDYIRNVSLRLSKVLHEIGVNERIVIKRKRAGLMNETFRTVGRQLTSEKIINIYSLGSRVEGTTTHGLNSDEDSLYTDPYTKVIEDWNEWEIESNKLILLMIQNATVTPGYCLLQILRQDVPLPAFYIDTPCSYSDRIGRSFLKNLAYSPPTNAKYVKHGPAQSKVLRPGFVGSDLVPGIPCQQWPLQARQWINKQGEGQWPTDDMKQYCKGTVCFVVPVGGKGSVNEDIEWRISTSLAERYLMFNLNITQIRCYVLMKMILKTFIKTQCPNSISSYMCKNVLLHCISSTENQSWNENTLLICLNYCLTVLYKCVLNEHCPHLIIPDNNLMAKRFTPVTKQIILERLCYVIHSNGNALLEVECDQLGSRIQSTFMRLVEIVPEHKFYEVSGELVKVTAYVVNGSYANLLENTNRINDISLLLQKLYKYLMKETYNMNQGERKLASCEIAKFLCMHLGSALASINIQNARSVCRESIVLMTLGLNIDAASGKLKLASIFYCTGDIERAEIILRNVAEIYDLNVVDPICSCYIFRQFNRKREFDKLCYEADNEYTLLQSITASCVRFLRWEKVCCPKELQHEMFRSTQQDLTDRCDDDTWMDLAVVDSLPYLYFLQYKTYSHLRRHRYKQVSISNLAKCIEKEPDFGHRETALNLLGQCMEQENKIDAALKCYLLSLKIRGRNNTAKLHICRLVSAMLSQGLH